MEIPYVTKPSSIPVEEAAFEEMFRLHFRRLYAYAITIVKEEVTAEEIVHNVFYKIWEKKGGIDIQTSVTAYLYRAVYNDSLNYLKHKKVKLAYAAHAVMQTKEESHSATSKIQLSELQQKLDAALSELPEQCRTIFQMSRFEDLKYAEIAGRLGISVKTVENQMGKALKILRTKLADYLPLLIVLLESFNTNNC
jgi:RNA polymerase sigma-70 factor (ECF subfamily)